MVSSTRFGPTRKILAEISDRPTVGNFVKINGIQQDANTYIAYVEYNAVHNKVPNSGPHLKGHLTLIKSEKGWIITNVVADK